MLLPALDGRKQALSNKLCKDRDFILIGKIDKNNNPIDKNYKFAWESLL
jgi:hypothetical protein